MLKKPQPDWFTVTVSFQSQLCGLCCVEETTARLVYCDSFLLTQLCGLCCVEETTARLVYCDSVLPVTTLTMQFLLLPGQRKSGAIGNTVKDSYQNWSKDCRLSSLLRVIWQMAQKELTLMVPVAWRDVILLHSGRWGIAPRSSRASFSRWSHTSDLTIGTPVATLPGASPRWPSG